MGATGESAKRAHEAACQRNTDDRPSASIDAHYVEDDDGEPPT